MSWKLAPFLEYFSLENLFLFSLFCLIAYIFARIKNSNYLDRSIIFSYPLIYFYPALILRDDIVSYNGIYSVNYTNIITLLIYVLIVISITITKPSKIKYLITLKSNALNTFKKNFKTSKSLKSFFNNKFLAYIIAIISFYITYLTIPENSLFHIKNLLNIFNGNLLVDYYESVKSRFYIYEMQNFSLLMSKIIIPSSVLFFFKPNLLFLPFFFINILNINMFAERQGLLIITSLALIKTYTYRNLNIKRKIFIASLLIIIFIGIYFINFRARNNNLNISDITYLFFSIKTILASLFQRIILDPYFVLVTCISKNLGYTSSSGIIQQLNLYFGIFTPIIFTILHLIISRVFLSPYQIENLSIKLIISFLYIYWIYYIDLISVIPFAISILGISSYIKIKKNK
tara:strand:+ start:8531 stop:9736 length:1206 start_codon:yes stop_codon:yes gene_type:complete